MARKRRRIRRAANGRFVRSNPRRRRRRATSSVMASGRRRRRRAAVTHRNPGRFARVATNPRRRRRYRRNPSLLGGSITSALMQGLKDGTAVVAGQVAVRKAKGAVAGMLPSSAQAQVSSGAGAVALSIASALAVAIAARKILPGQSRMITAGAFSEAINGVLATTPIAPFLAGTRGIRRVTPVASRMAAYPGTGARLLSPGRTSGVAAWPRMVGVPVTAGM